MNCGIDETYLVKLKMSALKTHDNNKACSFNDS